MVLFPCLKETNHRSISKLLLFGELWTQKPALFPCLVDLWASCEFKSLLLNFESHFHHRSSLHSSLFEILRLCSLTSYSKFSQMIFNVHYWKTGWNLANSSKWSIFYQAKLRWLDLLFWQETSEKFTSKLYAIETLWYWKTLLLREIFNDLLNSRKWNLKH